MGCEGGGGRGPYTYASTTLPPGLTLDAATGAVSGTPTVAGATRSTLTVTDSAGGTDTVEVAFTVKALLAFSASTKAPDGLLDRRYRWKIPVTGASKARIFLASGAYPPGLELDETTGILSGTPIRAGSFRLKVWVLGDPGTAISKSLTVRVLAG